MPAADAERWAETMMIRDITTDDLADCTQVFADVFAASPWCESWTPDRVLLRLTEIRNTPGYLGLVALDAGCVAGLIMGVVQTRAGQNEYFIEELCVARNKQRQGVGTRLVAALQRTLAEHRVASLYLITQRASGAAEFFARLGFRASKRIALMTLRCQRDSLPCPCQASGIAPAPLPGSTDILSSVATQSPGSEPGTPTVIDRMGPQYQLFARGLLQERWGSSDIVTRGVLHRADELPGFVALQSGEPVGLVTYRVTGTDCELISLDTLLTGKGIGSGLLRAVLDEATRTGCHRLWLVTTNDNTQALRFYQKAGFTLVAVHRNAIDVSRQLKPAIPHAGADGITIEHEVELEMPIGS